MRATSNCDRHTLHASILISSLSSSHFFPNSSTMPRTAAKLSNCYVPLPLSSLTKVSVSKEKTKRKLPTERDSGDGSKTKRDEHSLRRLFLESGVIPSAAGSALVELGHTKVIAQMIGPVTASSDQVPSFIELSMEEGTLHCEVKYSPNTVFPTSTLLAASVSTMDHHSTNQLSSGKINSWTIARETDLSSRLSSALAAAVPLKQYPKCALILKITVLQDDGNVLAACITAASLALADAAVEMYDLVTCGSVAVRQGTGELALLADPDLAETQDADAVVTLAVLPNWKEVTLWEQSGSLSPDKVNQAMELCRDGCRTMHRFMREHLLQQAESESMEE
jgi:exosome complex component MTR3